LRRGQVGIEDYNLHPLNWTRCDIIDTAMWLLIVRWLQGVRIALLPAMKPRNLHDFTMRIAASTKPC
jgi:hypothetical protein